MSKFQFALATLLTLGVLGLAILMLVHPISISPDAKAMIEGLIGQLVAVLVFVFHEIFRNPTEPPSGAGASK